MRDCDCIRLLQWALPRMRMRWRGFRKVRGQVCKRIQRRMGALSIQDVDDYRAYLVQHATEWTLLRDLCRVTISRFWRDKAAYCTLQKEVLPTLARQVIQRGDDSLHVWSAGCACGEEPYSVALAWQLALRNRFPSLTLQVLATDIDRDVLARAKRACYGHGSLKDLPTGWRNMAFSRTNDAYCLHQRFILPVTFRRHDVRDPPPGKRFDLIICRNLVFTYFDHKQQRAVIGHFVNALAGGGAVMLGTHEQPPADDRRLTAWPASPGFFALRGTQRG